MRSLHADVSVRRPPSFPLQLLWELDNGRSVGLSGVPDELLRSQLTHTLELLGLKCTKVGVGWCGLVWGGWCASESCKQTKL